MKEHLKLLFIFFVSVGIVYGSFLASEKYPKNPSLTAKASFFKTRYIKPDEKIIRVEIKVLDDKIGRATSELQSHSFISYAVFCLKKKNNNKKKK